MGITEESFDNATVGDDYLRAYDWDIKSRKKLFSGRSEEAHEKLKQRKRVNGISPATRAGLIDEDDTVVATTGKMVPGVIARLMGLDSSPKSKNGNDSAPILCNRNLECFQGLQISSLMRIPTRDDFGPCYKTSWPIDEVPTENLPSKSAKSISETHKKFQSPIKRTCYILPDDDDGGGGHVTEAENEIIEMRPQTGKKTMPLQTESSSATLKLKDSNRKVQASKRQSKLSEDSLRPSRLSPKNKSWNGAVADASPAKAFKDCQGSLSGVRSSNGKSVSLAVLAKENVRRRTGLGLSYQKESSASDKLLMSHLETRKGSIKEATIERDSKILRQNNQKQNKIHSRGNSPVKSNSRDGRVRLADSSSARRCCFSNAVGNSEVYCKKLVSEVKVDKKKGLCSDPGRVRHGGQSKEEHHRPVKVITSSSATTDKKGSGNRDSTRTEADVISFTFTSPLSRSRSVSGRPIEAVRPDSQRLFSTSDGITHTKLSSLEHSIKGSDSSNSISKSILQGLTYEHALRLPVDFKPDSPVSVLEHSNIISSCKSSDSSNSSGGVGQCPSNGDTELSDTASSVCDGTSMKRQETTLTTEPRGWELEYVKAMLHNIEKTFDDYALGRNRKMVNHHIFDQLEDKKVSFGHRGLIPGINTRLLFDIVNECLDFRCRFYVRGGFKSWAKAMQIIERKDVLARDVYKEMCDLSAMKDFMVNELIDWDMSHRGGRWLGFDAEALELGVQIGSRILDSLIYELVNDISGF